MRSAGHPDPDSGGCRTVPNTECLLISAGDELDVRQMLSTEIEGRADAQFVSRCRIRTGIPIENRARDTQFACHGYPIPLLIAQDLHTKHNTHESAEPSAP